MKCRAVSNSIYFWMANGGGRDALHFLFERMSSYLNWRLGIEGGNENTRKKAKTAKTAKTAKSEVKMREMKTKRKWTGF